MSIDGKIIYDYDVMDYINVKINEVSSGIH